MKGKLGWKKGIALALFSGALFLLLLEGGARLVMRARGQRILTIPARFYWENTPGMSKVEEGVYYRVNSLGFRGRARSRGRIDGKRRVVCLGDSSTFGFRNDESECYPFLLERCLGDGYEVINAGVSGYTTLQEAIALKLRVLPLKPDLVVIQCGHNNRSMTNTTDRSELYRSLSWRGILSRRSSLISLLGSFARRLGIARSSHRFSIEESLANVRGDLKAMVELCRNAGAGVILLSWGQNPLVEVSISEGIALCRENRYREAREKFTRAEMVDYNWDWRPAHYLGICHERLGDEAGAAEARRDEEMLRSRHPWVISDGPYLDAFREAAEREGVPLLEYRDAALRPEYFLDICHPSAEFTSRIADDLCRMIREILP